MHIYYCYDVGFIGLLFRILNELYYTYKIMSFPVFTNIHHNVRRLILDMPNDSFLLSMNSFFNFRFLETAFIDFWFF